MASERSVDTTSARAPLRTRLAGIRLLRSLPPDEFARLERSCSWRRAGAGEQILDRDSPTRDVLFVTSGRLRVVNYSASGREIAYAVVEAGGHVGELSALDGLSRSASVVAIEPCEVASLSAELFHDLLLRHGSVAVDLLVHLTGMIRIGDKRIAELSTVGAVQRVYRELIRRAVSDPGKSGRLVVSPLPTQHDLASQVGATRETVARALSQIVASGVVERRGRMLLIHDPAELRALADPDGDDN
jgi:CRP-like cAMP-binding protein